MPDEPINFTASASRLTAKKSMTDLTLHDPSVIAMYEQVLHSASNLLDIAQVAATSQGGRYVSGITSRCPVCQFEETIEIPALADVADIIQAVKGLCPICEEIEREEMALLELANILNVEGLEAPEEE